MKALVTVGREEIGCGAIVLIELNIFSVEGVEGLYRHVFRTRVWCGVV